jgi:glucose uptake protein
MRWRIAVCPGGAKATTKGVGLSLACGVAVGLFYPFVAKALTGPNHLGPYTVFFVFSLGAVASNFPMNFTLMRRPVSGPPLRMKVYFRGRLSLHGWGILGGVIWGIGTIANFVASYVPMIGPATSFSLGEGNTMIPAIWGIFVWREFHGAGKRVKSLLAIMFVFFILGLSCIALAPVIQ